MKPGSPVTQDSRQSTGSWLVAAPGARRHYAAALAMHRAGRLERLYTDIWAGRLRWVLRLGPGPLRAMAGRYHAGLADADVRTPNLRKTLSQMVDYKRAMPDERQALNVRNAPQFARFVADDLDRDGVGSADKLLVSKTVALELLPVARQAGLLTLLDMYDAGPYAERLVGELTERVGVQPDTPTPEAYWERVRGEWAAADVIVAASDWTRRALIEEGVSESKIGLVPLPYEPPAGWRDEATAALDRRARATGPLRVLFLGRVNVGKGLPDLLKAARALDGVAVDFTIAGGVTLPQSMVDDAPPNVRFIGRVQRDAARSVYLGHDVFVFPTWSDGFGLTQLEAMSAGLPVVATWNCGDVVQPGVNGDRYDAGNAEALADILRDLADDRDQVLRMSRAALGRVNDFSLAAYAENLDLAAGRGDRDGRHT